MKFSLFRTAKPRQFDYIPRYYDPEKERREERRKELLGPDIEDMKVDGEHVPGYFLRERIKYRRGIGSSVTGKRKRNAITPLRGIIILAGLAVLVLWALDII